MKKIRAHHLLCMQGFQGYGYSSDFVEKMSNIIVSIESSPESRIKVVKCCDDICYYCPNNIGNICRKNGDNGAKIRDMDQLVLDKLGFREGYCATAGKLLEYVNKSFDKNDALEVCGNCAWKAKCLWYTKIVDD